MGALLERKKAVGAELKTERREQPLPTSMQRPVLTTSPRPDGAARPAQPAELKPAKPDAPIPGGTSTTSRLLDQKRKRQQDKDDT
jgi:hypothetical protein